MTIMRVRRLHPTSLAQPHSAYQPGRAFSPVGPFLYGLGALGEEGVTLALDIIRRELDVTLALCGLKDVRDVDGGIFATAAFNLSPRP
jgi:hypothetical protein